MFIENNNSINASNIGGWIPGCVSFACEESILVGLPHLLLDLDP